MYKPRASQVLFPSIFCSSSLYPFEASLASSLLLRSPAFWSLNFSQLNKINHKCLPFHLIDLPPWTSLYLQTCHVPYQDRISNRSSNNFHSPSMPPRIPTQRVSSALSCSFRSSRTPTSFIASFIAPQQQRFASILSDLSDTPGAYNKRIRRGRGPASGKGKTSGRGHKGQKQHGKVPFKFNGGQTPDVVVSGTRGFENQYVGLGMGAGIQRDEY